MKIVHIIILHLILSSQNANQIKMANLHYAAVEKVIKEVGNYHFDLIYIYIYGQVIADYNMTLKYCN